MSYPASNQSPRRYARNTGLQTPRRYPGSGIAHPSSRDGSDLSTPPDSPYNSQNNLESVNG